MQTRKEEQKNLEQKKESKLKEWLFSDDLFKRSIAVMIHNSIGILCCYALVSVIIIIIAIFIE